MSIYAIPSGSMSWFVNIGTDEAINIVVITLCQAELISVVKHALSSKPQGLSTLLGQGEANLMKHALGAFFFLFTKNI